MLVLSRPVSNACPAVNVYHIMHVVYISMSGYVQAHENMRNKSCVYTHREQLTVATIQLGGPETMGT